MAGAAVLGALGLIGVALEDAEDAPPEVVECDTTRDALVVTVSCWCTVCCVATTAVCDVDADADAMMADFLDLVVTVDEVVEAVTTAESGSFVLDAAREPSTLPPAAAAAAALWDADDDACS